MKSFNQLFAIFVLMLFAFVGKAQNGVLTGVVSDNELGESLISAYVIVEGTEMKTATDFDGKYSFTLPVGTYTIKVSYIGYADKQVTDVEIKDNETTFIDINMAADAEQLDEVVISAKVIERSENSVLLLQKKSIKIQDGISAQELSKQAVGNVAGAMKKITGATVQDGKYLNVRGLGDRYSLAQLDGVSIPSVDPYNNSASLDFIPTNIIDNIIASKTFTPDQPGTFTGGNVNIKSKSFPEKETFKLSLSGSYNNTDNLINGFLSYDGGKTDLWGFDDGTRGLPVDELNIEDNYRSASADLFARVKKDENITKQVDALAKSINYTFVPEYTDSPINHGIGMSYGNKYGFGESQEIGLLASVSFKRSFDSKNDYQNNFWLVINENSDDLKDAGKYNTTKSSYTPELNTFAGISYKLNKNNTFTFKNIYNHQADKASRYLHGSDGFEIEPESITEKVGRSNTFTEIGVNSSYLAGNHLLEKLNNIKVEWTVALINSKRTEPNLNYFSSFREKSSRVESLSLAAVSPPTVIWRDLHDMSTASKLDVTIPAKGFWNSEFKVGGAFSSKNRDFNETRVVLVTSVHGGTEFNGNFEDFLGEGNLGHIGYDSKGKPKFGNFVNDESKKINSYDGSSMIGAGYGMWVAKPADFFRFVVGARYETTNLNVESKITQLKGEVSDSTNTADIQVGDILPAVSLIFSVTENSNLRLNYSKTIARPNLREIAPFAAFDPLLNAYYLGNTQLRTTDISNYDIRYEWFFNPGELLAVSAFYKDFTDPIAQTIKPAANTEFQFINVDNGKVSGIEIEARKDFGFITPALTNLKIGGNVSFIQSEMDIPDNVVYRPKSRTFTGQSPLLANVVLSYNNPDYGLQTSLSFNHQGKRLYAIGDQAPDEYISPFNSLDFAFSKEIGRFFNVKLTARNLLNQKYTRTVEYKGKDYITTEYPVGRTFGIGVSYSY